MDIISVVRLKGEKKMKIEDNRINSRHFGDLAIGDIFKSSDRIYIKIEQTYGEFGEQRNAVNLSTGKFMNFDEECSTVELLNDVTLVLN